MGRNNWMGLIRLSVLSLSALVCPAIAAGPYQYTLIVGPYLNPPDGPFLNIWIATWKSKALLVPPTSGKDIELTTQSGFTVCGAPLPGYSMFQGTLNEVVSDGFWGVSAYWNPSGSGDQVLYSFYFSLATPPSTPGTFVSYRTTVECCGKFVQATVGLATLIISDLAPPPPPPPPPSAWTLARIRVSFLIDGPVTPPPGSPVEANVGFTDFNGNPVVQPMSVSIIPGEVTSIDLDAGTFLQPPTKHANIFPVVTAPPGTVLPPLKITTEVFDRQTGIGTVLASTSEISQPPGSLAPQGMAGEQVMRLIATAYPPNPCVATLSFADSKGNPIGPSLDVNLNPGASKFLDFDSAQLSLKVGQRIEVQPIVTLRTMSVSAGAVDSACGAVSEVFDRATGRTATYQNAVIR